MEKKLKRYIGLANQMLESEINTLNRPSEIHRILLGLSVLKDTYIELLESKSKRKTSNVIGSIVSSDIQVRKHTPPNFSSPLRPVK